MNRRVLVVEASLATRMDLHEALQEAGFAPLLCATAADARAALGHGAGFALVVLDPSAPDADGAPFLAEIRRRVAATGTPLLLLVDASAAAALVSRGPTAPGLGPEEIVFKPYDRERVVARALVLAGAARGARGRRADGGEPKRVLVVDDSRTHLHVLSEALRDEGYVTTLARSGEEALQALAAAPVDGILLDMVMPGLSGLATCRRIKEDTARRSIPLLMLTARDDEQAILDALSAGADDFVTKSGDLTVLKARLRAQLRRKHFEDENRRMRELLLRREMEAAEARADRELRQSEERFRLLVEGVQDYAIIMLDPTGHIASWNAGAERIYGYRAHEIIGRPNAALFTPEDAARGLPEEEIRVTTTDGRSFQEGWRVRKDGTRYLASVVVSVLRDDGGRLRGFAKVTRDVTERRRAQEAQRILVAAGQILGESLDFEDTLRRVAHVALPDFAGLCVLLIQDEAGQVERYVTAHVDPSMASAADLLARITRDSANARGIQKVLRTAEPELIPDVTDSFVRAIAFDDAHYQALRALDLASHLTVPLIARGRTLGTLSFASTTRRYDAADLDLAQDIAARAALAVDNARLYREAQEAVRARDDFLTIASHELRTPLTPLQLQLDSLARAAQRGVTAPDRLAPRLDTIRRQVDRLSRLIQNLLDISRISAGRLQLELQEVDLGEVVAEALARFRDELAANGCEVRAELGDLVIGTWDRLRLDQIVTNLLSNACKYGAGKPVEVRVEDLGASARLVVRDHGIGIAPEQQERIFQRFERAVSSENYSGFGLGLWIVKQIADALGATIGVESRPGEGSTFTIDLPKRR